MDSNKVVALMDEVFCIVRDYPIAYNAKSKVREIVAKQMAEKHNVSFLPSKALLIDGCVIDLYRRGKDSIYEIRCEA